MQLLSVVQLDHAVGSWGYLVCLRSTEYIAVSYSNRHLQWKHSAWPVWAIDGLQAAG